MTINQNVLQKDYMKKFFLYLLPIFFLTTSINYGNTDYNMRTILLGTMLPSLGGGIVWAVKNPQSAVTNFQIISNCIMHNPLTAAFNRWQERRGISSRFDNVDNRLQEQNNTLQAIQNSMQSLQDENRRREQAEKELREAINKSFQDLRKDITQGQREAIELMDALRASVNSYQEEQQKRHQEIIQKMNENNQVQQTINQQLTQSLLETQQILKEQQSMLQQLMGEQDRRLTPYESSDTNPSTEEQMKVMFAATMIMAAQKQMASPSVPIPSIPHYKTALNYPLTLPSMQSQLTNRFPLYSLRKLTR